MKAMHRKELELKNAGKDKTNFKTPKKSKYPQPKV